MALKTSALSYFEGQETLNNLLPRFKSFKFTTLDNNKKMLFKGSLDPQNKILFFLKKKTIIMHQIYIYIYTHTQKLLQIDTRE